jgi:acetoin utilization protein AcuC
VHHGDGVQAAFYDDPRVLTISLHEHPATLFPGTGFPGETGTGAGEGYAVNVALPAGTGDAGWLRALDAVALPLLRDFKPTVLVSQHGCDSHRLDPLANLELTIDAQRSAQVILHDLAHELCDGRWVATGGGGYALVQVVPRIWTHLLAIAAGAPVDPEMATPARWRELARSVTGETAPLTMTDGSDARYVSFSSGADPSDPVDRAIMRTRSAVFPAHGLLPQLSSQRAPGCPQHARDVLLSGFLRESAGGRKGLRSASATKVSTLRRLWVLALFRTRLTLGYVRDWCAESGQACSASRGRGQ